MTATHKNFLKTTISAVASAGLGAFTISAASSGYRTFVAGDDGKTFDGITIKEGTAWEVRDGCVYTHSGASLSRGTLIDSSTGSAIAFTSAAVVQQSPGARFADLTHLAMVSVMPGGRLTLESGVPVSTSDQTAKTSVYYTPFVHNVVPLWDGYKWVPVEFSETTLALGTLASNVPYDVFGYLSAGALSLELLAWKNSTVTMTIASPGVVTWNSHGMSNGDMFTFATTGALPTGLTSGTQYFAVNVATNTFQIASTPDGTAINTTGSQSGTHTCYQYNRRGTAVTLQDGRYCKSGDKTRLLLGSIFTDSTTTTADSTSKRYVSNAYNQVPRRVTGSNLTSNTYTTTAFREWNAGAGSTTRALFMQCFAGLAVSANVSYNASSTTNVLGHVGVGLNNGSTMTGHVFYANTTNVTAYADYRSGISGIGVGKDGLNFVTAVQYGTTNVTWISAYTQAQVMQ